MKMLQIFVYGGLLCVSAVSAQRGAQVVVDLSPSEDEVEVDLTRLLEEHFGFSGGKIPSSIEMQPLGFYKEIAALDAQIERLEVLLTTASTQRKKSALDLSLAGLRGAREQLWTLYIEKESNA
jgi:hypothetical protein